MNAEEYKSGACNCEKHSSCQYCKFELCLILPIVAIVGAISVFVLLACNNLVVHSGDSHVTYYYSAPIDVNVDKLRGNWLSVPDSCSNSTSLFLRQIGVPADMTRAVMATKMEITITFQFNPQVGSVTLIKASPDNRELFEESRDVSKTILLHNNRWTENKVMQKTYFLNFTGEFY